MKAEERKELETNVLADRMGKIVQTVKGGPNRRAVVWVVVAVVAVLGVVLWLRYRASDRSSQAKGWFYLGMARTSTIPEQRMAFLTEAAKSGKGSVSGGALMEQIWLKIHDNSLLLRRQPVPTLAEFANLASNLNQLQTQLKDQPFLQAEALYHLCVIQETRAILDEDRVKELNLPEVWERLDAEKVRGKFLDTAKGLYEDLAAKHKNTPYADMANKRLEILNDSAAFEEVRETYRNLSININLEDALKGAEARIAESKKKNIDID